jgi:hypothetical protein
MKAIHWPDTPVCMGVLAHDWEGAVTGRFYLERETIATGSQFSSILR